MLVMSIPYFNELTANQLDASINFDGNTPVSHLNYSLAAINRYFQGGQVSRPKGDIIEVLPGFYGDAGENDGVFIDQKTGKAVRVQRQSNDDITMSDDEVAKLPNNACSPFDLSCYLQNFMQSDTAKDVSKRVALFVVAVLLLAVAIISLR